MTREEALKEANQIVAECIAAKDRLVQEVIADHLITTRNRREEAVEFAARIVLAVCEIPDRNSPDDQPEMMLVTPDELRSIVCAALEPNQ
jgi:hypothetical protein